MTETVDVAGLTLEHFTAAARDGYLLAASETFGFPLTLVETHSGVTLPDSRTQFRLEFEIAVANCPEQGIYRIHHPTLGVMDLFLTPVAATPNGFRLEACFT
ncbi:MAG: hypothetical protein SF002_04950 [Alphaproteobacteria bacterium]|nr:hypothetical protein [Alphaproteobacteria bacterium]